MGAASNSSAEWLCCRGCLATDVKLFDMHEHRLAAAFGYITGIPVLSEDGLPQQLCAICCSLLAKSAAFRDKCRRALCCLQLHEQSEITTNYIESIDRLSNDLLFSLTVTPVEVLELGFTQSKLKLDSFVSHAESMFRTDGEIIATSPSEVKNEFGTDLENDLELFNDFEGLETDDDETSDNISVTTDTEVTEPVKKGKEARKKTVNKVQRVRKRKRGGIENVPGLETDSDEPIDNIPVDKVPATTNTEVTEPVKKGNEARQNTVNEVQRITQTKHEDIDEVPGMMTGSFSTDYWLTKLKNLMPTFNFGEFATANNVDIHVLLTTEEQVADWNQFNASAKRPKAFRCEECGKGFGQQVSLKKHLLRHNPRAGPHVCAVCSLRFDSATNLRTHQLRHTLQFKCRDCGFVSRAKNQAQKHFVAHAGVKFACKYCDRSYTNPSSYYLHMRMVHAARAVACADCGESFISRRGLQQHQAKTHKVQRVMSACACASCDAPFDSLEALRAHEAEDGGCRPDLWPCAECGESLTSQEALRRHIVELHEQQINCPDCDMVFSNYSSCLLHRRRAHEPRARRRRPGLGPKGPAVTTLCEVCGQRCQSAAQLITHRRKHTGEKPFPCPDCDLRFVTKANMRRHHVIFHQGHREFRKCEECGKMIKAASFYTHVRGVHRKIRQKRRRNRNTEP